MRSITRLNHWLPVVMALCGGCGKEGREAPVTVTARDSAGVTIVTNRVDTAALRDGWRIAPEPVLTLGGLDAPESQQFFQISGAKRFADGRIVLADGGSAEIRVYGPTGNLQYTHGRKGEGPGEFQRPHLAGVLGADSLVVYDSPLRRVTVLHLESGYARSHLVGDEGGGLPVAIGATADGGLAIGGGMFFSRATGGFPTGAVRPNSRYVVLAPDGSLRGDLGDVPAAEMFARVNEGGGFSATALPFGRVTRAAVTANRLWMGTGDAWEVRAYNLDAALRRIVRIDRELESVTARLRQAYLDARLEHADSDAAATALRNRFADMPIPDRVPPYQTFAVDAAGHLWIGEYLLPGRVERTYTVVDQAGRVVGRVSMPVRTTPLDIGDDYVLGVTLDDLDVERLTVWELERGTR